jgi:orotidine-5'-phosphate decarboxylase
MRMAQAARKKKSRIILAIDPRPDVKDLKTFAKKTIGAVAGHVCAVKVNFHLLLPLGTGDMWEIAKFAHSHGLLLIADIKLNDIDSTNEAAVEHLARMGFDAVIANPFMGSATLSSLVEKARARGMGVIALVYMSHPDAGEGYGMQTGDGVAFYRAFLDRAIRAQADGVVVGATQAGILREVAGALASMTTTSGGGKDRLAIYSPGVGAQGGDAAQAVRDGSDYLIVGRSIVEADDPSAAARSLREAAGAPG